jgi:transcriptional regulator with XRE-family HTH domain
VDDEPYTGDLHLASVTTLEELAALLRKVHVRADKPSLRMLEARTRHEATSLSKTTVSEMLKGIKIPRKAVMVAFLRACGVHDDHMEPWRRAWERVATPELGPAKDKHAHAAPDGEVQAAIGRAEGPHGSLQDAGSDAQESKTDTIRVAGLSTPGDSAAATRHHEPYNQLNADDQGLRREPGVAERQQRGQQTDPSGAANVQTVRSPTVRRRQLGALLRVLRSEKGLTVEQVAERLLCSPSKVSRMETGHGIATPRDIRDLCDVYGVTDESERDRLMTLAREGKQSAWWQSYDLTYATYAGLEAEAVVISAFQSSVVPGLLQTADYARAGHNAAVPRLSPDQIELQIEAKLIRQRILTRDDPPRFAVVLDEAALHRMVGGREVMAAQLAKLLDMTALPNIVVQILPYELGAHPAMESNFSILELPIPAPGVVYVEGLIGSIYLERPDDLKRYSEMFDRLQSLALNPKDAADLIMKLHRMYRDH